MSAAAEHRDFSVKRINAFACGARLLAAGAMRYHRLAVEGSCHLPHEGPALILPKHCAYRDILLEGVLLYRLTRRYANYIMKVGLWGILEWMGRVKVVRPKDIRRIADREQRRAEIRRARAANQQMQAYLDGLYQCGELVVSHPEGMRYQDKLGPLQKEVVEHLLQAEERLGMRIPLIPVGLEYDSYARPGARVYFRVDEPLFADSFAHINELMDHLSNRLRVLSGLA